MTCKEVLLDFLKKNEGWHKKVHLYAIAEDWSAETVGRDLRDMAEEKIISVDYYDGKHSKGLAKYAYNPTIEKKLKIIVEGGIARKIYV